MSANRIVVVNFTRLGDLLQSGPMLRALRTTHPGSRISLVVLNAFREIASRLPSVDNVIGFDLDRFVGELDATRGRIGAAMNLIRDLIQVNELQQPDILFNLSHTPRSALFCGLLRPVSAQGLIQTTRAGASCVNPWLLYTLSIIRDRKLNPFHLVDIYRHAAGGQGDAAALEFALFPEDHTKARALLAALPWQSHERRYAVLIPGSNTPERRWPVSAWSDLAKRLAGRGTLSIVAGATSEVEIGEQIAQSAGAAAVSLCGQTELATLAAILQGATVVVGNDTGTLHLATAVGARTIGLYIGPASVKDTGPYQDRSIALEPDLPNTPCDYRSNCGACGCGRAIGVDSVDFAITNPAQLEQAVGIRAWHVAMNERTGFRGTLFNRPVHTVNAAAIEFYRWFWLALLDDGHFERPPRIAENLSSERRRASASLQQIAQSAVDELAHATGPSWLNELQVMEDEQPFARPIASFLRVSWTCLPRADGNVFLAEFERLVNRIAMMIALLRADLTEQPSSQRELAAYA